LEILGKKRKTVLRDNGNNYRLEILGKKRKTVLRDKSRFSILYMQRVFNDL
jgi:hypothetical protein